MYIKKKTAITYIFLFSVLAILLANNYYNIKDLFKPSVIKIKGFSDIINNSRRVFCYELRNDIPLIIKIYPSEFRIKILSQLVIDRAPNKSNQVFDYYFDYKIIDDTGKELLNSRCFEQTTKIYKSLKTDNNDTMFIENSFLIDESKTVSEARQNFIDLKKDAGFRYLYLTKPKDFNGRIIVRVYSLIERKYDENKLVNVWKSMDNEFKQKYINSNSFSDDLIEDDEKKKYLKYRWDRKNAEGRENKNYFTQLVYFTNMTEFGDDIIIAEKPQITADFSVNKNRYFKIDITDTNAITFNFLDNNTPLEIAVFDSSVLINDTAVLTDKFLGYKPIEYHKNFKAKSFSVASKNGDYKSVVITSNSLTPTQFNIFADTICNLWRCDTMYPNFIYQQKNDSLQISAQHKLALKYLITRNDTITPEYKLYPNNPDGSKQILLSFHGLHFNNDSQTLKIYIRCFDKNNKLLKNIEHTFISYPSKFNYLIDETDIYDTHLGIANNFYFTANKEIDKIKIITNDTVIVSCKTRILQKPITIDMLQENQNFINENLWFNCFADNHSILILNNKLFSFYYQSGLWNYENNIYDNFKPSAADTFYISIEPLDYQDYENALILKTEKTNLIDNFSYFEYFPNKIYTTKKITEIRNSNAGGFNIFAYYFKKNNDKKLSFELNKKIFNFNIGAELNEQFFVCYLNNLEYQLKTDNFSGRLFINLPNYETKDTEVLALKKIKLFSAENNKSFKFVVNKNEDEKIYNLVFYSTAVKNSNIKVSVKIENFYSSIIKDVLTKDYTFSERIYNLAKINLDKQVFFRNRWGIMYSFAALPIILKSDLPNGNYNITITPYFSGEEIFFNALE